MARKKSYEKSAKKSTKKPVGKKQSKYVPTQYKHLYLDGHGRVRFQKWVPGKKGKAKLIRISSQPGLSHTEWQKMSKEIAKVVNVPSDQLPLRPEFGEAARGLPAPATPELRTSAPPSAQPSETLLVVRSHLRPNAALKTYQLLQKLIVPNLTPAISICVQVLPAQLHMYQPVFAAHQLDHVLEPGCAGADGQVILARARCKEMAHLVVCDDNICGIKVNDISMKCRQLRTLITEAWEHMMVGGAGGWTVNTCSNLYSNIYVPPFRPARSGLNLMYGVLFGQVVKHSEDASLCVRHGQILDDIERTLRTRHLYVGGIQVYRAVAVYKRKKGWGIQLHSWMLAWIAAGGFTLQLSCVQVAYGLMVVAAFLLPSAVRRPTPGPRPSSLQPFAMNSLASLRVAMPGHR